MIAAERCASAARARSHRPRTSFVAIAATVLVAGGCAAQNETIDEHPCPPSGTNLTYDNFGKGFLDRHCQTCHGAPTSDRNGAPEGITFGSREAAQEHRDRIFARAADGNTTMPPGPDDPPADERAQLADWLACGAP